ncbi:hypothetical protein [Neobacillus kokaensis]|uniref:Uncharacterized protein n=1 Tax=Neobacillus kokaensis TaxID=2759023 RepID=A0ABQ3NA16_9BACI|nr:hypothetical protein [Neobacillus kokaensis]GHI00774.1 hypothetical protein AM1BK_43160 [Neobacillus kokaensis]
MSYEDIRGVIIAIQSCKLSEGILNQFAMEPSGEEIAFKVHYWGVTPAHMMNISPAKYRSNYKKTH